MDKSRFDSWTRTLGSGQSRRAVLKTLTATALGAAGLVSFKGVTDAAGSKVGICHLTGSTSHPYQYITVAQSAVPAHLAHGDTITSLTDTGNCGACGNACAAPTNATATCTSGTCGFECNDGYQLNAAGDACEAISLCPIGYEPVNGACFEITGIGQQNCNSACSNGYGNVDGSGQFLCGAPTGQACNSTADCPSGQACTTCCGAGFCIAAC